MLSEFFFIMRRAAAWFHLCTLCFATVQAREREEAKGASKSQTEGIHSASTDFNIQERDLLP